jgi:hypothetical protein
MATITVLCPSYKGISDAEVLERASAADLEAAGHRVNSVVVRRVALLDVARNELFKQGRRLATDYVLWLDDDARVEARTIRTMLLLDLDVVAAPVQMRGDARAPNISIVSQPVTHPSGLQTVECSYLGLGCVLMKRSAVNRIWDYWVSERHYRSPADGKLSVELFGSTLLPVAGIDPTDTSGDRVLLGDDLIFSWRMREAGLTLRALLQAVTQHADLPRYCLAEDERYFRRGT